MPSKTVSNVQRQVAKARRRLFVQTLLDCLAWCWVAALVLSTVWFLVQPWLLDGLESWVRWAIAGGAFAAATAVAVWLAWRRAPSPIDAALELDNRFKLKERATTSLTLAPLHAQTAAGLALAADADAHVAKVDVRQGFPVRLSRIAALVPASGAVLALVAIFYNPVFHSADADAAKEAPKVANANEIAEKFDKLKKQTDVVRKEDMDSQLAEIDKLREKLLKQPFDPSDKDKLRQRLQQLLPLEEKIKNRVDDLKAQQERTQAMQAQLKAMGKDPQRQLAKDGPAKALEDALNRGDLDKAQKEIMALADKLKSKKLSDEERKLLQKQLEEIQEKLNNVADLGMLKEQLRQGLADGSLTKDEFDKLMARAAREADDLEELQVLGKLVGECKGFLSDDDLEEAANRLVMLARYIRDFDPDGREMRRLLVDQQCLCDCIDAMRQGLLPGGQRPVGEEGKTGSTAERQRSELDGKTPFVVTGAQKGGTFSKIPPAQVGGAFRQAQQDAPEAIERQQVPPDAAEMLRGYYQNLGGGQKK